MNSISAQVARNLGYPAILLRGFVGDEDSSHTWVQNDDQHIDLAGAQFGRKHVWIFSSDPEYHAIQSELLGERTRLYPEDEIIVYRATKIFLDSN